MTGFLTGCATALITPFCDEGVNFCVLKELIERQIGGGASALVVLGTTGEPATMTESEKERVLRFCIERAEGRIKIVAGVGSNCTKKAVSATKNACKWGADGVLAVTPYYNKCTQKGLIEYYRAISEASPLPVVAYNVPSRTGVNILPETMAEIALFKNVAGLKDACGNMAQTMETLSLIRGKCDLYSGEDALNLPILCAGGSAVVSVVSNLAPRAVASLTQAVERGDLNEARRYSDLLLPLSKACFVEVNPIPVKAAMRLLGVEVGLPRPPLTPLEEAHFLPLENALREAGLL